MPECGSQAFNSRLAVFKLRFRTISHFVERHFSFGHRLIFASHEMQIPE